MYYYLFKVFERVLVYSVYFSYVSYNKVYDRVMCGYWMVFFMSGCYFFFSYFSFF